MIDALEISEQLIRDRWPSPTVARPQCCRLDLRKMNVRSWHLRDAGGLARSAGFDLTAYSNIELSSPEALDNP